MASSAGSAQTAESELVPWQPSREDAVALGPKVGLNPFWSEKAREEAQLKALRPRDLPEVEEARAPQQVITQNHALWQEMKSLKEQVRTGVSAGPHQHTVSREGVAAESRVLPGPSDGRNGGHRARRGGPEDRSGYQTPTTLAGTKGGAPPGAGPQERGIDDGRRGLHPGGLQGGEPAHCGDGHGPRNCFDYGNGWVTGRQDVGLQGEGQTLAR